MKKLLPIVVLMLLVPTIGLSQGNVLQVSTLTGKVEFRTVANKAFQPLSTVKAVNVGDEIKTGPGASVVLTLPDSSIMQVSENSHVKITDSWSGGFHDIVNVLLGRVRVHIEKIGGRDNNSRVQTPTALIAVRGTTFDINVVDAKYTEVLCLEGKVEVENPQVADRQVLLGAGMRTAVEAGQAPLKPVKEDEVLNRTIYVVKQGTPGDKSSDPKELERLILQGLDNDKSNRPTDRYKASPSGTDSNVGRAKVSFPE